MNNSVRRLLRAQPRGIVIGYLVTFQFLACYVNSWYYKKCKHLKVASNDPEVIPILLKSFENVNGRQLGDIFQYYSKTIAVVYFEKKI